MIWSVLLGEWQYSVSNPSITTPQWQSLSYGMGASRTKLLYVCICCDWQIINHISDMYRVYKNVHTCSLSDRISSNTSSGRRQLISPSSSFWLALTLRYLCTWPSVCNTHTHTLNIYLYPFIHDTYKQDTVQYSTDPYVTLSYCIYYINGGKSWHSHIYILFFSITIFDFQ